MASHYARCAALPNSPLHVQNLVSLGQTYEVLEEDTRAMGNEKRADRYVALERGVGARLFKGGRLSPNETVAARYYSGDKSAYDWKGEPFPAGPAALLVLVVAAAISLGSRIRVALWKRKRSLLGIVTLVGAVVAMNSTAEASRAPFYKTYSVLDAGTAIGPKLTRRQLEWLQLIKVSPMYGPLWKRLRFAKVRYSGEADVPLIVFDPDEYGGEGSAFHIIGAACSLHYVPAKDDRQVVPIDGDCGPATLLQGETQFMNETR